MALATKCPHCNTTFRVAHDQLKLRGGIVRCGACNEVFDGNAALVDPAPRAPVIIDLPEVKPAAAPAPGADTAGADTGLPVPPMAQASAVADTPQPQQPVLPVPDAGTGPAPESVAEAAAETATERAQDPAPALAHGDADLEPEHEFDLDLNGDEPPAAPPPSPVQDFPAEPATMLPALHAAADDAFDLDFDIDTDHPDDLPAQPVEPARTLPETEVYPQFGHIADAQQEPAFDTQRPDGRREPTLDIPEEHLTAVAPHDSFELDAYQHTRNGELHSADESSHTLDASVWRSRSDVHHLGDEPPAGDLARTHSAAGESASNPASPQRRHDAIDDGDDDDIVTLSSGASAAALAPEPTAPATPVSARAPEEPGFVKRSRRKEQWGKASRIAMACALPLLLAGLAYQAVATFRNPLAAAMPALKPALAAACDVMGCKVELPSQLDALSIEQGELQTMADNIFSFSTSLRNQSATAQNWPHIELILNDSADKPVLRRVFAPRDYLPQGADFASGFLPRSEQPVKLYFELSRVKASGYHIAVFYP